MSENTQKSNTKKILALLQEENLTIHQISNKLKLSENDVRGYINRLKNNDFVYSIGKDGRYKIYTLRKHVSNEFIEKFQELLFNTLQLHNLIKYKMDFKKNITPAKEDLVFLDSIKERIELFDSYIKNLRLEI